MAGYALSQGTDSSYQYRAVGDESWIVEGETFYASYEDFPQEAKDWFSTHVV